MPELLEQMYCSQQIVIPPKFPYILKRYCKAAIKTQPYDLLRWSFEYFRALAERRPPPVKLRLEYPVYSTEGGLTRGCLKVLANQLLGMTEVPMPALKAAWRGFCLDPNELTRIICLCEAHLRKETISFLKFIAVAGGLLTKNLTHTMILLCETLTKEPDGGSAAIPVEDFLEMYTFLARTRADKDVRYINGYREGDLPTPEPQSEGEEEESVASSETIGSDEFWLGSQSLKKLPAIDASITTEAKLSNRMNEPILGKIQRSPSAERAAQIERENYMRERKGRAKPDEEVEQKLRDMSESNVEQKPEKPEEAEPKVKEEKHKKKEGEVDIVVLDEDGQPIPYEFYGEPDYALEYGEEGILELEEEEEEKPKKESEVDEEEIARIVVEHLYLQQARRREDLQETFDEIARTVDRYNSANYDLGCVAGRQMSITSGEFIVQNIEKEILEYIDEQIAILPDPDLKKKKAKPEEVEMVREVLDEIVDQAYHLLSAEKVVEEEEEGPIPDVITVYAVPGIGPVVTEDMIADIEDYATDVSRVQANLFMPRNIRHFLCPPLEKYEEYKYNDYKKEELPTVGKFTE